MGKNPKMSQSAIARVMGYRKALRGGGTEHGRIAEMLRRSTKSIHDHILKHGCGEALLLSHLQAG
ncbi:hypothetical protein CW700_04690 [Candidatus Bathyarchaeota archaeon]|nr:MAG: hypothetical protein CW700_04690 [Candidatus Bathyarchaeota archaeon]